MKSLLSLLIPALLATPALTAGGIDSLPHFKDPGCPKCNGVAQDSTTPPQTPAFILVRSAPAQVASTPAASGPVNTRQAWMRR